MMAQPASSNVLAAQAATPPQSTSPLLALAAELRNTIYYLALTSNDVLPITKREIGNRTALLRTCNQVKREASSIFYGENSFKILLDGDHAEFAAAWLTGLGSTARLLKKLSMHIELTPHARSALEAVPSVAKVPVKSKRAPVERAAAGKGAIDGSVVGQALANVLSWKGGLMVEEVVVHFIERPPLAFVDAPYREEVVRQLEAYGLEAEELQELEEDESDSEMGWSDEEFDSEDGRCSGCGSRHCN